MKFQLPNGLSMYYETHGKSNSSKTLIFIGGLSQSSISWKGFLPLLQNDYQIILLDLIFQGQSDSDEKHRSFEQHAEDVKNLVEHLSPKNPYLIGISYGGAVLQRILVNHPNLAQKAVIMASFAHKPSMFDAWGLSWLRSLNLGGYELMLDVMLPAVLGKSYFENPIIPIDVMKTARKDLFPKKDNLLKLMQATAESGDYRRQLKAVNTPTLVMVGEEDILCTPSINKAIADAIPNSEFHLIPKVGHTLNLEAIPQSVELIKEFC